MQIILKQARQGRMRQRAYELSLQWIGGIFFFLSGKRPYFFPFFSDEGFPKIFLLFSKHLPIRFCWKINCTLVLYYFYRCTQTLLILTATFYSRSHALFSWRHDGCTVYTRTVLVSIGLHIHRYSNCNLVWFQMIFIGCLKANQISENFVLKTDRHTDRSTDTSLP